MTPSSDSNRAEAAAKAKRKDAFARMSREIARKIAAVAAVLAAILSVLMIANYLQTKSVDPLKSTVLTQMMTRFRENPDDTALKDEIRALDLLARKAYFTRQWQLRTGSYLLFAFVLVFILSLKYIQSFRPRLPDLTQAEPSVDSWTRTLLSRKYFLIGGAGVFALALAAGILSESELKKIGLSSPSAKRAADYPTAEEVRSNWPGFRGPDGNGIAAVADVPTEWDGRSGKNILWKTAIPLPGQNSPIVWNNRIFLSGADRNSQVVYGLDAVSGKILWQSELNDVPGSPAERPRISADTGYAAPTLAVDGKRVFALFATGDLGCFDFEGKRIWAKNLGSPDNHYGHASSLAMFQDLLFVQFDQNSGGQLFALRADNGQLIYDKARDIQISWASPIVAPTGRRTEIILSANPFVISYDPRTGEELWRVKCMSGEIAPSPAYADGMVFAVNQYARLAAIRLGDKPEVAWEYLDDLSEVSSLVATKDFVVMAASFGTVSCFDSKTGVRHWIQDFPAGFYSSPILAGDTVYLIDMEGVTQIFKAAKTFQLVGRNELGEKVVAVPALMPGRIYIRGEKHLFGIGKDGSGGTGKS